MAQQIDAVLGDIGADAVKTGMLSSAPIIEVVADRMKHWDVTNLVVDPVMVAKGGDKLLRDDAVNALKQRSVPLALVVTPNMPEAEVLVGRPIKTWDDMREAAREIHAWGVANVVIKGGHREEDHRPPTCCTTARTTASTPPAASDTRTRTAPAAPSPRRSRRRWPRATTCRTQWRQRRRS